MTVKYTKRSNKTRKCVYCKKRHGGRCNRTRRNKCRRNKTCRKYMRGG